MRHCCYYHSQVGTQRTLAQKLHCIIIKSDIGIKVRQFIHRLTDFDYSQIDAVEVDGIDTRDYPDFCDAYITYAEYKGKPMTEAQLERLNDNSSYVYDCVIAKLF